MNTREALRTTSRLLDKAGLDDARLEAELLLLASLKTSRTQLYTEPGRTLTAKEQRNLRLFTKRRLKREPTAYILKSCQFYGLDFYVNKHTLIPRPETELLVETAIATAGQHPPQNHCPVVIADIGTGSGNIAISLALALPRAKIYASDISDKALQVARLNCQRHQVDKQITLLEGDLLDSLPESADIITANMPYIRTGELDTLSPEIALYEPAIALNGGDDGLSEIRRLIACAPSKIRPRGHLLLEIGQGQSKAVLLFINSYYPQASTTFLPDLGGIERIAHIVF